MADRKLKAAKGAFDASIDCGITFFVTAEVYGTGISGAINSESLLGRFIKERQRKEQVEVAIATKFAALPWSNRCNDGDPRLVVRRGVQTRFESN